MRKDLTLVAALFAASLVATPLVMSGTKALATSGEAEAVALPVATMPVEVAPIAPATESCTRKVRVVYSGYGTPSAACAPR